ncbi:MAG: hypothetical protein JWO22_2797 [Frankiales bacterium]|nr:hypothetical protein [Frankiales bacterium]
MKAAAWVVLIGAVVGFAMAGAFVWSVVQSVRRTARRARRAVEPARVRTLTVRGVVSPTAAARRDLAADVLRARQAYELAVKVGRPVPDMGPVVAQLEKVARSLDVDLRFARAVPDEVTRARRAARSLVEACAPDPVRSSRLDDVADAAELARLTAQARRELS